MASTGVHGANRLASNSTLECLVFGRRCANVVNGEFERRNTKVSLPCDLSTEKKEIDAEEKIIDLKGIMVKYCGIVRNGKDMLLGLDRVSDMLKGIEDYSLVTVRDMELYNMASVAFEVLQGAYNRKESVGAHYRVD